MLCTRVNAINVLDVFCSCYAVISAFSRVSQFTGLDWTTELKLFLKNGCLTAYIAVFSNFLFLLISNIVNSSLVDIIAV